MASSDVNGNSSDREEDATSMKGANGEVSVDAWDSTMNPKAENEARVASLKREIFQMGASYNRGFAASPKARDITLALIEQLEGLNPEQSAADGVDGSLQSR